MTEDEKRTRDEQGRVRGGKTERSKSLWAAGGLASKVDLLAFTGVDLRLGAPALVVGLDLARPRAALGRGGVGDVVRPPDARALALELLLLLRRRVTQRRRAHA
eukprot:6192062-Pleurochrysis_carterae.AAC.1